MSDTVHVEWGGIRIIVARQSGYQALRLAIAPHCQILYRDEDNDWVTIANQADFDCAVLHHSGTALHILVQAAEGAKDKDTKQGAKECQADQQKAAQNDPGQGAKDKPNDGKDKDKPKDGKDKDREPKDGKDKDREPKDGKDKDKEPKDGAKDKDGKDKGKEPTEPGPKDPREPGHKGHKESKDKDGKDAKAAKKADEEKARLLWNMAEAAAKWGKEAQAKGDGEEAKKQLKMAQEFLESASSLGHSDATYRVARNCELGRGVDKDVSRARSLYVQLMEKSHAGATCALADLLPEEKMEESIALYEKAAHLGSRKASFRLYQCVEESDGKTALSHLQKAASAGLALAEVELGYAFEKEKLGLLKDLKLAAEWYEKAANHGNTTAMCNLAYFYKKGTHYERSEQKSFELFERAAQLGNLNAMFNLGKHYEMEKSMYKEAFTWYAKGAKAGHKVCECFLGLCYKDGIGVEEDGKLAREWLEKAAGHGEARALCELGQLHELGACGLGLSFQKAAELYIQSAKAGWAAGQWNAARCFEKGIGVVANRHAAAVLYLRAYKAGEASSSDVLRLVDALDPGPAFELPSSGD